MMTRYLIIEDEMFAYRELKRMMDELRPQYQMAGWAQSIVQGVALLSSQSFDLILADISLADGLCFDIFEQTDVDVPVIFTTAYDEYAIKAFKSNGIDYLLKPIERDDLAKAVERFERRVMVTSASEKMVQLKEDCAIPAAKTRFLVQCGDSYLHVTADDIALFCSEDKYTYLYQLSGKRHIIDYSLDRLEEVLDREKFFRVSRNCIVGIKSVSRCSRYFGGRLKLHLQSGLPEDIVVSRSRAKTFLDWIDGIV